MNSYDAPKCVEMQSWSFVYNLTSSYTNRRNEGFTVATSIAMFLLAALFFNLNLFSRFSDVSAILNPSVRFFLSTSLSLFLPVMSYLFSEAKNECFTGSNDQITSFAASNGQVTELPLQARVILLWMLLVELLRKKVDEMLVNAGVQGYSGTIERGARITWLGYLIFYNLKSPGKKAFYGIIWILPAAKLVQRFVTSELAKRSFAYGKNPQLLASYMAKMLRSQEPSELLKDCNYVVMGEEELLEKKASGHHLELTEANRVLDANHAVITVGKVWKLAEDDELIRRDPKLKRLCLSFALYKLLRRRLAGFPITDAEARNCHDLIFKDLCEAGTVGDATAFVLFQVFNDEVQFLCENYHSVHPVVLASPYFFLVNYVLSPIVVWAFCLLTIILCGHGKVFYAFHSFYASAHNYIVSLLGIMKKAGCIMRRATKLSGSAEELYATVDISITVLLLLTFIYEEVWEVLVFLLSNWFMVSLLCSYTSKLQWRQTPFLRRVIRCILWVRNWMSQPNVCFKQFSVLWFFRLSWALPTKAVPIEAKTAIMKRLLNVSHTSPPSNGRSVLLSDDHHELLQSGDEFLWACESARIDDVILTWHIATALLEAEYPLPKQTKPGANRKVATSLSGYCAYLVAFHPELLPDLPDDKDGMEPAYKDMKEELKKVMGSCWRYYCSPPGDRYHKLMEIAEADENNAEAAPATALRKGARLGKVLIDKCREPATTTDDAAQTTDDTRECVWKLLADVWTEVMVYAAPTGSELHFKAHKEALAQGGEFITLLWAMATHTGISRVPAPACDV